MKMTMVRLRLMILPVSLALLLAPFWAPRLAQVGGRNTFMTADSMFLLGFTLLVGMIYKRICPSFLLCWTEKFFVKINSRIVLLLCLFFPFVLIALYAVNRYILHSFMNSADEHSCYFLAECFRMGKWWISPHPLSEFFDVVHVGNKGGKWFSVYPFGWPLIMALGIQLKMMDWMNPLLTVFSLVFLFKVGRKIYGTSAAWFALLLVVLTPYFMLTGASYFSHSTCLLMMSLFAYAYLRWRNAEKESARNLWAILAALAVGYGLATRYLTMAVFVAPFIITQIVLMARRRERIRKDHILFMAIVALFFCLIFYQNFVISGKIFKAPNRYDKSWERLGFRDDYTILDALVYVIARGFYLIDWTPPVFLLLFVLTLFQHRTLSVDQKIFRYAFFYPVVAYFFYFSWGGNQYGPRYYFEGFPFLMLTMTDGLRYWWRVRGESFRKFLFGVMAFSVISSGYVFHKQSEYFEDASRQRKALYVLAETTLSDPSIVFVRGFLGQRLVMSQEDAVRNKPSLDGRILYAHDKGDGNKKLMAYYPDRRYYLGYFDRKIKQAKLESLDFESSSNG